MRPGIRAFIAFVLVVIVGILLVSFVVNLFTGEDPETLLDRQVNLEDYIDSDATVSFVTKGRIVAEEDYREIRIRVSPSQRVIQVVQGYQNNVIASQSLPNNRAAYSEFLRALQNSNFTRERTVVADDGSDGQCPLRRRFTYEAEEDGRSILSTWSSSCNLDRETFNGNRTDVRRLFQLQIPDYADLTRGIRL